MSTVCPDLSLDFPTLESLDLGAALLDEQGQPICATRASQPWLRHIIEMGPALAHAIRDEKSGKQKLPLRFSLVTKSNCQEDNRQFAWLVANAPKGYALLFWPGVRKHAHPDADADYLAAIAHGVCKEYANLVGMLRNRASTAPEFAPLLDKESKLAVLIGELEALAALYDRDEDMHQERLSFSVLMNELVCELNSSDKRANRRYAIDGGQQLLGPVYGNRHWLKQALGTLLRGVERGCPPRAQVQIKLRQFGDFAVLNTNVSTLQQGAVPTPAAARRTLHETPLSVCRRIILLHGGQLNLRMHAQAASGRVGEVIESFTLALPTGGPEADRLQASCADCRISFQAMQYARDLARLMAAPNPTQPNPLPEEGDHAKDSHRR